MTPDRHKQLTSLFERALQLGEGERSAFAASVEDTSLRRGLELLLASDREGSGFLDPPPESRRAARRPREIGEFVILEELGRGGMGVVYRARQSRPEREVALKLLHPGLLSAAAAQRLEREANVLGRMEHPGIARVYRAGAAEVDGATQPYIAMELIDGEPITRAARAHTLDIAERVRMLARVARIVQHAHSKGVIHRDLKPANILVCGDRGEPKVVDFGIALSEGLDVGQTLQSGSGSVEGTIGYMSPEQLRNEADIDTRSDVYALGVIGFELLSGELPYAVDRRSLSELVLAIEGGGRRSLASIDPSLRGDLDAVLARCLEHDRDRRYDSAAALADDLEAYLDHRPVAARPSTVWYQARKYAERNRAISAAVGLAALSVVMGVALMAVGLVRAKAATDLADARAAAMAEETARSEAIAGFYHGVLLSVDPALEGASTPFIDVLASAEQRAAGLTDHPRLEADARFSLGFLYRRHGRLEAAERNLRRAVLLREAAFGADDARTAVAKQTLAQVLHEYRGAHLEALSMLREAARALLAEPEHENIPWIHVDLARVKMSLGRLADARGDLDRCEELVLQRSGPESPFLNIPLIYLARWHLLGGDGESAAAACRRGIALSPAELGQAFPRARLELQLARALRLLGDVQGSLETLDAVEASFSRLLPGDHPLTATLHATRCRALLDLGRMADAHGSAVACLEMRRRTLHADHEAQDEARMLAAITTAFGSGTDTRVGEIQRRLAHLRRTYGVDHPLHVEMSHRLERLFAERGLSQHAISVRLGRGDPAIE